MMITLNIAIRVDVATPVSQRQARPGHSVAQRSSWELVESTASLRNSLSRDSQGVIPEEQGKQGWRPNGARTATSCPPRRPRPQLELRIRKKVLLGAAPELVHPKRLSPPRRPGQQLEMRTQKTMMQLTAGPAPVLPKRLRLRAQKIVAAMPWLTLLAGAQHIPPARHAECVHCASGQSTMASPKHAHQMLEQTAATTADEPRSMPQGYPQGIQF